jgi:poly(A) polymerase Pap1/uncharacterized protein (UPF0248 family)
MTQKDKLAVLTLQRPCKNVTRNVTRSTRSVLVASFNRGLAAIRAQDWASFWTPFDLFGHYKTVLQLSVEAVSQSEFDLWTSWIESRLVDLLVRVERTSERVLLQPAPSLYANPKSGFPYACCYYLGIAIDSDKKEENLKEKKEEKEAEKISLTADIEAFDLLIREFPQRTDGMALAIKMLKSEKVPSVLVFVMPQMEAEETSASSEEEVPEDEKKATAPSISADSKRDPKKKGSKKDEADDEKASIGTSEQIFNRIKWDPQFNPDEFYMGYEDRFLGMQEVAFHDFRKEDFIPWHRVWYFKQNGKIVWDRKARFNLLK